VDQERERLQKAAMLVINLYGAGARSYVSKRAQLLRKQGDALGARAWLRVAPLIEELQQKCPEVEPKGDAEPSSFAPGVGIRDVRRQRRDAQFSAMSPFSRRRPSVPLDVPARRHQPDPRGSWAPNGALLGTQYTDAVGSVY